MECTREEWQKLFPILQTIMTKGGLTITLSDENASLQTTLPKEMVDGLIAKWKELQDGTSAGNVAFGRYYTGAWKGDRSHG